MNAISNTATMRAAVVTGPERIEVQHIARPEPSDQQVLIRLEGCGVCGSNLPLWEGRPWFQYPREPGAPGHEGWGVVERAGRGVAADVVGQRVAMLSYKAFAEYDVADAAHIVPLPAALADRPFPGEALGCAMNIFRRSAIEAGDVVAVVGSGFLGTLLVQLAVRAGARVIAISRRQFALAQAQAAGAAKTIAMLDHRAILDEAMEFTRGRGCEVVIEAVGEQWPLDLAAELTAERGRLVVAGYHQDPRQVNMQLWNWRGLDVINAHERAPEAYVRGIREAVAAVIEGRIDPAPLLTHRFVLDELGAALSGLKRRPDGMLKSWVAP
jgi:2-desacetyl-2-hydroxyethyl bacteriochlorophyllide A dehydrogenase